MREETGCESGHQQRQSDGHEERDDAHDRRPYRAAFPSFAGARLDDRCRAGRKGGLGGDCRCRLRSDEAQRGGAGRRALTAGGDEGSRAADRPEGLRHRGQQWAGGAGGCPSGGSLATGGHERARTATSRRRRYIPEQLIVPRCHVRLSSPSKCTPPTTLGARAITERTKGPCQPKAIRSTTWPAMASDAVAAGDGALHTDNDRQISAAPMAA
ncbi:MAG: hypothetical protein NVS3B12_26960 [Acidimicrobiales bacterium]